MQVAELPVAVIGRTADTFQPLAARQAAETPLIDECDPRRSEQHDDRQEDCGHTANRFSHLFGNHFVQTGDRIERARVTNVGKQLRNDGQQCRLAVTDVRIALNMPFHLRFATAQRHEHRKK